MTSASAPWKLLATCHSRWRTESSSWQTQTCWNGSTALPETRYTGVVSLLFTPLLEGSLSTPSRALALSSHLAEYITGDPLGETRTWLTLTKMCARDGV